MKTYMHFRLVVGCEPLNMLSETKFIGENETRFMSCTVL
jgi:hypothetical protein